MDKSDSSDIIIVMSAKKKAIRRAFRDAVFERARYRCECCGLHGQDAQGNSNEGLPPLDAHHITNRNLMPNGGYVKENGISVCSECHEKAEDEEQGYEPEVLYEIIGSSREAAELASQALS